MVKVGLVPAAAAAVLMLLQAEAETLLTQTMSDLLVRDH
jgi:hypothetical protein